MDRKVKKSDIRGKNGLKINFKTGKKFLKLIEFQRLITLVKGSYEKYLFYCRVID